MVLSGRRRVLWQILNPTQHFKTFQGKKNILQLLILDKMTTATKINKTNEPHSNREDVAPGPSRLLPAVDSTEHGCDPWSQVPPAFLLL